MFCKSLLFGSQGSYTVLGIPVTFEKDSFSPPYNLGGAGIISKVATFCIQSNLFRLMTQGYTHIFIHEMGHAVASKLLTNRTTEVSVFTNSCTGMTTSTSGCSSNWKNTVILLAGPMNDINFCICKLAISVIIQRYVSWILAFIVGIGAIIWISGELLYAFLSSCRGDHGDFGRIRQQGNIYLFIAIAIIVAQCSLGIFAVNKLL